MADLRDQPIGKKLRQVVLISVSIALLISYLAIIGSEVRDKTTHVRAGADNLVVGRVAGFAGPGR